MPERGNKAADCGSIQGSNTACGRGGGAADLNRNQKGQHSIVKSFDSGDAQMQTNA